MAVYKYESGELRPSFLTFIKLAHHLRISVASLVEQAGPLCQAKDADGWNVLVKAIYAAGTAAPGAGHRANPDDEG